jgi:glycosyltransferase involved in cell wall biosynthesis
MGRARAQKVSSFAVAVKPAPRWEKTGVRRVAGKGDEADNSANRGTSRFDGGEALVLIAPPMTLARAFARLSRRAAQPANGDGRVTVMRIIDRLNIGGPAIHAVVTSRGLDRRRFRTVLVIGSIEATEGDMAYLLEAGGVEQVVSIPSLGREMRALRDLRTGWQVLRLMWREQPHVVHTHKAKAGAIGRAAAFLCRVPVRVHTFHGHVLRGYFSPLKSRAYQTLERLLALTTSRLVVPSPRLADELAGEYQVAPRERFEVVPLGFDLQPFATAEQLRGQLRAQLGVAAATPLVGIVGRMVPVKDHATFVAAAALLAQRNAEVRFVFVGGGELQAAIEQQVTRAGLESRAHFLGWRRDLARIYADLDVVALSSINEGTPVSLIEAMASGTPVVSTAVGGVPDVLRGGARGELAPTKDPAALAAAIERALRPEARQRAASFRGEIHEQYGAGRLCRQLEALYDGLLADRRPAAATT